MMYLFAIEMKLGCKGTKNLAYLQKKDKKICVCQKKAVPLHPLSFYTRDVSRSRAVVARQAHNLKVGGSIPPSATKYAKTDFLFSALLHAQWSGH